jgi:hypothetical protein
MRNADQYCPGLSVFTSLIAFGNCIFGIGIGILIAAVTNPKDPETWALGVTSCGLLLQIATVLWQRKRKLLSSKR